MAGKSYAAGAAPRGSKLPGRISAEDLEAGNYPADDVRNKPEVRRWLEEHRRRGAVELPKGLPVVWRGHRRHCPSCGALSRS